MTKRWWSWFFLFAAAALTIGSVWLASHQLNVLTRWKAAEGTLLRREVLSNHDSDGYLYFQVKALFRYQADGKERTATAVSSYGSADFGWIARQFGAYSDGARYPLRYDPAKPEIFEFGAGLNKLYFRTPVQCFSGAAICLLLGLLLRQFSRPLKRCIQCRKAIRSFFRYCPDCGESISMA
jgi:hypothetical protein